MTTTAMHGLARAIREKSHEIIDRWEEEARTLAPYLQLPRRDDRLDHLAEVIADLALASLSNPNDVEGRRAALHSAAQHGSVRRDQGFEVAELLVENAFMRQALWRFIQAQEIALDVKTHAILRIDALATLTSQASIMGFHQGELASIGSWPRPLDELIHAAPFLAARPPRDSAPLD